MNWCVLCFYAILGSQRELESEVKIPFKKKKNAGKISKGPGDV